MQDYYYYSKIPSPRPLNCMKGLLYSFDAWPSCAKIAQIICRIESVESTAHWKRWGGRAILRTLSLAAEAATIIRSTTDCVMSLASPFTVHCFEHQRIFFISILRLAKIELFEDVDKGVFFLGTMPSRQDKSKKQASYSTIFRNIYLVIQTKECLAFICMMNSPDIASKGIHIF